MTRLRGRKVRAQEIADEVGGTRDGVRKVIARFRADARLVYLAESGVDLGEDCVVEFGSAGYRQGVPFDGCEAQK